MEAFNLRSEYYGEPEKAAYLADVMNALGIHYALKRDYKKAEIMFEEQYLILKELCEEKYPCRDEYRRAASGMLSSHFSMFFLSRIFAMSTVPKFLPFKPIFMNKIKRESLKLLNTSLKVMAGAKNRIGRAWTGNRTRLQGSTVPEDDRYPTQAIQHLRMYSFRLKTF